MSSLFLTDPGYPDEKLVHEKIRSIFSLSWLSERFRLYHEIPGQIIQPKPISESKDVRIDFIVFPTSVIVKEGWTNGIIGIECKRSETKCGPVVSQCLDYSRSLFDVGKCEIPKNLGGIKIFIDWIFICPATHPGGDFESVMAQNRLGCAQIKSYRNNFYNKNIETFLLQTGSATIIDFDIKNNSGKWKNVNIGLKAGSR